MKEKRLIIYEFIIFVQFEEETCIKLILKNLKK